MLCMTILMTYYLHTQWNLSLQISYLNYILEKCITPYGKIKESLTFLLKSSNEKLAIPSQLKNTSR